MLEAVLRHTTGSQESVVLVPRTKQHTDLTVARTAPATCTILALLLKVPQRVTSEENSIRGTRHQRS